MQSYAKVCDCAKKIKGNYKKKTNAYGNNFMVIYGERYEFKGSYRKNGETYRDDNRKDDLP